MNNQKTYSEKLRDPRWQKKRLEIMQRDEFSCKLCGDNETTLHVHHKEYLAGHQPWEYSDDNFITYCQACHSLVEDCKPHKVISVKKQNYATGNEYDVFLIAQVLSSESNDILFGFYEFNYKTDQLLCKTFIASYHIDIMKVMLEKNK